MKWRIWNGRTINIWRIWSGGQNSYFHYTTIWYRASQDSNIIDPSSHTWNLNLVTTIFNQEDIDSIKAKPLLNPHDNDTLFWKFTPNGTYNVCSAYHCLMDTILENDHLKVNGSWMKIWKLGVPPKVRHFLWRALRGCLPTRQRLILKGVQCPYDCCHCSNHLENEWHIFVACDKAQEFWQCANLFNKTHPLMLSSEGFLNWSSTSWRLKWKNRTIKWLLPYGAYGNCKIKRFGRPWSLD